ncbi:MAG: TetR/AcrR family transcriptional regulator [Alphaproteobacteria bacterium]|nr:TetR/AcrR family transcriptional regulator [Alphaproteobacteria bacterium]
MKQAPSRTLRKRERTRKELVSAAETLVAQHGLDALSIDEITEAADVAKGTFYTHFSDKADLAAAIGDCIRVELEERVAIANRGIGDAAIRLANGLATFLVFAIDQPLRARALIRLTQRLVDPEMPVNAGIRGDVTVGVNTKRFWASSIDAAVVSLLGIAVASVMHLTGPHPIAEPHLFARQALATALVAVGLKQSEAERLAKSAVENRRAG